MADSAPTPIVRSTHLDVSAGARAWSLLVTTLDRLFPLLNVATFFVAWEVFARGEILNPMFFPAPSEVARALVENFGNGLLWEHLGSSARNFVIGMGIASATAIPLGLVMGAVRPFQVLLGPYVWALASLPTVALVPLVILIFGFTDTAKIALILVGAIFPIMINCMEGVRTVDPTLLSAARVYGANRRQRLAWVVLPNSVPFVVSGVNQGMTQGLIGLVVSEMFATSQGLGHLMVRAQQAFDPALLYGVMVLLAAISLSFVHVMRVVERAAAPWRAHRI